MPLTLRDCLQHICTEWNSAKTEPFSAHPLAESIRKDFADAVRRVIEREGLPHHVKGSAGAGNWAAVPWLSLLDPAVTESTQEGHYVVYLFRADGSGVYASLNQGTTKLTRELGTEAAKSHFNMVKLRLRDGLDGVGEWLEDIELRSHTTLGASYEPSNIAARFYPTDAIPSNEELERDLLTLLGYDRQATSLLAGLPLSSKPLEPTMSRIPKPFLILAGISGTGKTRWVRKIAEATGDGVSNICLIPVRPDWHESSDLMGYVSRIGDEKFVSTRFLDFLATAWKDAFVHGGKEQKAASVADMTPHWVCLDEMNLAPVEQYFADFLSILETRDWDVGRYKCDPILPFDRENLLLLKKRLTDAEDGRDFEPISEDLWQFFVERKGIPLPPNLIVVGTVNMDETTHAFSRKVLDRAFTVEFEPHDVCKSFAGEEEEDPVLGMNVNWAEAKFSASSFLSTVTNASIKGEQDPERPNLLIVTDPVKSKVTGLITDWNTVMQETPYRVAYRTLNEALLHVAAKAQGKTGEEEEDAINKALDDILMMKLLPRLEGDADKLGCNAVKLSEKDSFPADASSTLLAKIWESLLTHLEDAWPASKSRKKLLYMAKRLSRTGYTSFWP